MWEVINGLDSSTGRVAVSLYKDGLLENKPCHYIDRQKPIEITPKRTKAEKTKLLHNFALDAVYRCTAETRNVNSYWLLLGNPVTVNFFKYLPNYNELPTRLYSYIMPITLIHVCNENRYIY